MKTIDLNTQSGQCKIEIGTTLSKFNATTNNYRSVAIVDTRVYELYRDKFNHQELITINAGELSKTLSTVHMLYKKLLNLYVDRSTKLIGVGGGSILDISGFVAATFLRGLPFVSIPTTLLAQADAAIGGKNGINLCGYKNLVGTLLQPCHVICDLSFLKTLNLQDKRNGLFEIIKHALIGNRKLFELLERYPEKVMSFDVELVEKIIFLSLRVKSKIVSIDMNETFFRRKLNLGHTLAHSLEKVFSISHGDAVGVGIVFATRLSKYLGKIAENDAERIERLMFRYGVLPMPKNRMDAIEEAFLRDKKRLGPTVWFVLPIEIGRCVLEMLKLDEIKRAMRDMCQHW